MDKSLVDLLINPVKLFKIFDFITSEWKFNIFSRDVHI